MSQNCKEYLFLSLIESTLGSTHKTTIVEIFM